MASERSTVPTPLQALILWALIVRGGTAKQNELKPELKKPDREKLKGAGLLRPGKEGRTVTVELTDAGWRWASDNTAAPLPARANGMPVLSALLARLGAFMAANDVALADFIRPVSQQPAPPPQTPPPPDLTGRIRAAYLAESGGAVNRRVRLATVRARLADVPRPDLDAALLALAEQGGAGLMPLDDPTEIGAADRDAAILIGIQARHILWLDR
jgi:hypothetical protein